MSNLLKQYYVTNPSGTVRVIDSNKRADIAIKEHSVIGFQPLSFSSFDEPSDEQSENEEVTEGNESTSISEENEAASFRNFFIFTLLIRRLIKARKTKRLKSYN